MSVEGFQLGLDLKEVNGTYLLAELDFNPAPKRLEWAENTNAGRGGGV